MATATAKKNAFTIEGNLTRDPELRYTNSGKAVCSFGLALDNDDNKSVAFVTGLAWEKAAEDIADGVFKGGRIKLEVRVNTRNYKDGNGKTVWVTEFVLIQGGRYKILNKGTKTQSGGNGSNNGNAAPSDNDW